jgi:NADH-quinone oxidoreductase subunit C
MDEISEKVLNALKVRFPQQDWPFEYSFDMLAVVCTPGVIFDVIKFLKEDEQTGYSFLTDITGIHVPADVNKELGVIYHLHNMRAGHRIRVKTFCSIGQPVVHSVTSLWPTANWMERETYDFFGIEFSGHPDLRRILNVPEMDYFPLRKQYKMEDQTRTDKEDIFFGRS